MEIFKKILQECGKSNASLVLVSKTKPVETIMKYYEMGHRDFGESRVQELLPKYEQLPKDIRWHMIGHLQTKKVKYISPFVHLIHSVDNFKLVSEIDKRSSQNDRVSNVLLELKIAEEDSKYGLDKPNCIELLEEFSSSNIQNTRICGLMGIATFTSDEDQIRSEFSYLKSFYDELREGFFQGADHFNILSMGMSGDYKLALDCGSNMLRIGTLILG
jgi:pyridoxal phosphate enzyme (YggS family)